MPGDEPMDPAAEVCLALRGALRPVGARRRVEPGLQIEEATLDHWEILLGDPTLLHANLIDVRHISQVVSNMSTLYAQIATGHTKM